MDGITRRALWRQRIVLLTAVLVGAVAGLTFVSSLQPPDATVPGAGPPDVLLVVALVCIGYGAFVLLAPPSRAGLRLAPGERAYFAPPRWSIGYEAASICLLTAAIFVFSSRPDRDLIWLLLVGGTSIAAILQVLSISNSVDLIEVTSEGIGYGQPRQRFLIPWAALDPVTPARVGRAGRGLRLHPVNDDLTTRTRLSLTNVALSPAVLVDVITHYVTHPGDRPEIGTEAGYDRLRALLTGQVRHESPEPPD